LILFFEKEKNFAKHVQLLNSQLQGQEFFTNMLADLQVAHYYLETFLKKESSFESLIKHVKNIQREAKLKVIETSMQNLAELKAHFAQIDEEQKLEEEKRKKEERKSISFFQKLRKNNKPFFFFILFII